MSSMEYRNINEIGEVGAIDLPYDEEEIEKRKWRQVLYPAISLDGRGNASRKFYFNVAAGELIRGAYVRVVKATIGGEKYLCFYGSDDKRHFKRFHPNGRMADKCFNISANGILEQIGLASCNYEFSNRPASPIRGQNGLAVRIHEKTRG